MPEIITNTSCLIVLEKINKLFLLEELYKTIYTTKEVEKEFGKSFNPWIKVRTLNNDNMYKFLKYNLDDGEASVISLALEITDPLQILDDLKARKIAQILGLKVTGTIGVLIKAKQNNLIQSFRPLLEQIISNRFRISDKLKDQILKYVNE